MMANSCRGEDGDSVCFTCLPKYKPDDNPGGSDDDTGEDDDGNEM